MSGGETENLETLGSGDKSLLFCESDNQQTDDCLGSPYVPTFLES